jgi:YidC/Oxa1 family membrane protein insertase
MEKRFLLAFLLSLMVLMGSQFLLQKYGKQTPRPGQTPPAATESKPESKPTPTPQPTSPLTVSQAAFSGSTKVVKAESEHEIRLQNALVEIVLSNRGGVVKSWVLKKYKDSKRKSLDLVAREEGSQAPFALALSFPNDASLGAQLNSALYAASPVAGADSNGVVFRYMENGVLVEKTLVLKADAYMAELTIQVTRGGESVPYWVTWPARFGDNVLTLQEDARQVVTGGDGKLSKTSLVKVKGTQDLTGGFRFGGVEDGYFAAIFLPENPIANIQVVESGAAFSTGPRVIRFFVGPKDTAILKQVDPQLEALIDYGWFSIIAKPIFIGLRWIYGYCSNYGLSVIILTIIINMAIFPLRWKSMVSAQKMQKLQPKIKGIQERYKKYKASDPKKQEMNKEMMALYKEHGVNPLGGCLPLLLQMPILVAFYNVLRVAIDLRQVSFLWIPDLSQYDKTFILVIIMVVTQFIMQKMTPNPSADPAQAKIFMMMPLIFGFMFAKVASGLVLYWLTGNVIGIIQQLFLNKYGAAQTAKANAKAT